MLTTLALLCVPLDVLPPSASSPHAATAKPIAAQEWMDLFDGSSLKGWTRRSGTAEYRVEGGAIVGTTVAGSPNTFLCTDRFYGDFELEFDVRLENDELNSGVQIRSHSLPTYRDGRVHGYQVEVAANGTAGFVYDESGRGWLSGDRDDPERRAAFRSGEWNRYRVICLGPTIRTWVNGVQLANIVDDRSPTGFIGLQVHSVQGDPHWQVAWKNIRLRELGDGGGYASLFNGVDLSGWRVNENPESVRVEDGAIVLQGNRAHAFYDGPLYKTSFKNFELRALVRTRENSNSGLYFHTLFQEEGWPERGYEVQVNNTHGDWRKTGGLYGIDDVKESPARDGTWFALHVRVEGARIRVAVDGKECIDYTEPENAERPAGFAGRLLDRGTFALQAHDPGSEVHFKGLRVRPLPE